LSEVIEKSNAQMDLGIYRSVQVLNAEQHQQLRVSPIDKPDFAQPVTDCLLTVDEFYAAARSQPIVFAKGEGGKHFAAALLGIGRRKNWFMDESGAWKQGEYMPAFLRRYPFVFVIDGETSYLGLDMASKAVNEETGERLFDDAGKPSAHTRKVLSFLQDYEAANLRTAAFVAELARLNLLENIVIQKWVGFQAPLLTGIQRVTEARLDKLPREERDKLVDNGYYKLIIAHLISLGHVERLSR
jgi:hypothetical protein